MGKNSRARRAAKAKQRQRRGTPRSRGEQRDDVGGVFGDCGAPLFTESERLSTLWWLLGKSAHGSGQDVPRLVDALCQARLGEADLAGETTLVGQVEVLFDHGWQPAELRREARRSGTAATTRLIELAIHAYHAGLGEAAAHPAWVEQCDELGGRDVSVRGPWLAAWREREGFDRRASYVEASRAVGSIAFLPPLDVLVPPPGAGPATAALGHVVGARVDPVLDRIRKLLAKAESTEFEAEAATFTAHAQRLMTRHAIDQAMLHDPQTNDGPRMMRVPVDAPYADAKSLLLALVAEASRSRAVFMDQLGISVVVGHRSDLGYVEMLFTSLLVQAQHALREAAREATAGTRVRSQSFRSSFYVAFAHRISDRLTASTAEVIAEADDSAASFLPVLRSRVEAVEDFVRERFGESLFASSVRNGYDYAGWEAGLRAADDAKLDSGELLW